MKHLRYFYIYLWQHYNALLHNYFRCLIKRLQLYYKNSISQTAEIHPHLKGWRVCFIEVPFKKTFFYLFRSYFTFFHKNRCMPSVKSVERIWRAKWFHVHYYLSVMNYPHIPVTYNRANMTWPHVFTDYSLCMYGDVLQIRTTIGAVKQTMRNSICMLQQ